MVNTKTNTICNCPECGKNDWNVEFKSDFYQYMPTFDKFDEIYLDGWFIFKCVDCGFTKEFAVGDQAEIKNMATRKNYYDARRVMGYIRVPKIEQFCPCEYIYYKESKIFYMLYKNNDYTFPDVVKII